MQSEIDKSDSWKMFDRIAPKYDLLNRLLSFGLDAKWRRQLNQYIPKRKDILVLDLATGTADVLISLLKSNPNIQEAYGIDMSEKMLAIGDEKLRDAGFSQKVVLKTGDANDISFSNNYIDVVTIAFGIRNMPDPNVTLKEMFRVLNSKGRAVILEFSLPKNPIIRIFHTLYLEIIVPVAGGLVSGNFKTYQYLNKTIKKFPYGDEFRMMMTKAGFTNIKAYPLLFGTATIYVGDK